MRIVGIRISNYGPFRGEFELELQAGVYAVVAQDITNPARSNWLGKTFLLSSITWALHGVTPKATLDAAISTGESEMGVDLELSDGTFITRTKKRGQSAQLRVIVRDGNGRETELFQELAQQRIHEIIGMGLRDFQHTVWMGQKAMSKFVTEDPADRTKIVTEWCSLEKVDAATKIVAISLSKIETLLTTTTARREVHHGRLGDRVALQTDFGAATGLLEIARRKLAESRDAVRVRLLWEQNRDRIQAIADKQASLKELTEREPPTVNPEMMERGQSLVGRYQSMVANSQEEVVRLRNLQGGNFDGQCPVMCAACPVSDQVLAAKGSIDAALQSAKLQSAKRTRQLKRLDRFMDELLKRDREWGRWFDLNRHLTTTLMALPKPDSLVLGPEPKPPEPVDIEAAVARQVAAQQTLDRHDEAARGVQQCDQELVSFRDDQQVLQTAIAILGAAKRRIATRALGAIESIANATLARSGVALTMELAYGRQLDAIAEVCDCGRAFPRSAKVKTCDVCGAIRGKKRDDKLHVVLSSVSGAAEDLAGVAIQLAAARWLRNMRRSPWAVVALDEPFGALDRHNRAALATALARIVDDGFEQAFIVAHNEDVLDALPHRLLITADGKWSRIEVV